MKALWLLTCRTLISEVLVEGLEGLDVLARGVGHLPLKVGSGLAAHIIAHGSQLSVCSV